MAILFTDLIGFSAWALKTGDTATLMLLREVGTAVEETAVLDHDGRIVKRLGDGLMATFLEPQQAVDAALDAQAAVSQIEHRRLSPQAARRRPLGLTAQARRRLTSASTSTSPPGSCDAAKADQVLVSDPALECVGEDGFALGRRKRLKASGTPRELGTTPVSRAPA